jgi:hypothetical protein
LKHEWREEENFSGLVRLVRLTIILSSFVFPTLYLDILADWLMQKCSKNVRAKQVDARIVAVYREMYYSVRAAFLIWALYSPTFPSKSIAWLSGYFIFEIMQYLSGGALVWGRHSIHPARSVVLAIFSYAQVTVAFAILYRYWEKSGGDVGSKTT